MVCEWDDRPIPREINELEKTTILDYRAMRKYFIDTVGHEQTWRVYILMGLEKCKLGIAPMSASRWMPHCLVLDDLVERHDPSGFTLLQLVL